MACQAAPPPERRAPAHSTEPAAARCSSAYFSSGEQTEVDHGTRHTTGVRERGHRGLGPQTRPWLVLIAHTVQGSGGYFTYILFYLYFTHSLLFHFIMIILGDFHVQMGPAAG